ncbi:MAG: alanine--glyoxylate aminotransferase family protein [Chloroflexota bacterium]|nr:alanine--glyoxylate aminotransferase family protein [Chloroflexota bacterium]
MSHIQLFIPGPSEVRQEILDTQVEKMIGHRSVACDDLFAQIQRKVRQIFRTDHRVYLLASSGSGLQEAAIRNGVRGDRRCASFVNGAFGQRWHQVAVGCGKAAIRFDTPWGQPVRPQDVDAALRGDEWDAITIVHNETSTGLVNPVEEIAALLRAKYPETLILVDAVSSLGGDSISVDEWELDVCLTSSQKALALPPGLAFAAVSDRCLARAEEVRGRGWYFDFLLLERYLQRSTTPATPAISLMWAANRQFDHILSEGMANRVARHHRLAVLTRQWALSRGFSLFAADGYRSRTVTCIENTPGVDITALNRFLQERHMVIANGYGSLKDRTFRIAHMGDVSDDDMRTLLATIDEYLSNAGVIHLT